MAIEGVARVQATASKVARASMGAIVLMRCGYQKSAHLPMIIGDVRPSLDRQREIEPASMLAEVAFESARQIDETNARL